MSEFLPLYFPADTLTAVTSAAVTGGQVVAVSGDNTVAATGGAAVPLGVAAFDAASGGSVTLFREGVMVLAASGAIAAGALVIPAAAGAVADIGAGTNYAQVVGVALAAAASSKVTVALRIA